MKVTKLSLKVTCIVPDEKEKVKTAFQHLLEPAGICAVVVNLNYRIFWKIEEKEKFINLPIPTENSVCSGIELRKMRMGIHAIWPSFDSTTLDYIIDNLFCAALSHYFFSSFLLSLSPLCKRRGHTGTRFETRCSFLALNFTIEVILHCCPTDIYSYLQMYTHSY